MNKDRKPVRRAPKDYVRYGREIAATIAERIAEGANWAQLAREPNMPSHQTFFLWVRKHPEFADMIARAEEMRADTRAEQALEVAMATEPGVSGDRLRVSTLIWHAAKGNPGRYGSAAEKLRRQDQENDPPPTRLFDVHIRDFRPVTLPDGRRITREMLPEGGYNDHE